jgi:DNA-binding CsgD family transcriptional regulator
MMVLAFAPGTPITNAMAMSEETYRHVQAIGDRRAAAALALYPALLALDDRDFAGSAAWYLRCLDDAVSVGYWHGLGWGVMGTVAIAAGTGRLAESARLHGAVLPHLDVISAETPPDRVALYHRTIDRLRERLGDRFAAECRAGAERTWPATVEEARSVLAAVAGEANLTTIRPPGRRGPRDNPELTERELGVLGELVAGHTNQEIASELGISPKTVMHHTVAVYRKLAVRGRAEAVAEAIRRGLVAS